MIETWAERFRPLETAANRAWWDAAVSGAQEDHGRVEAIRNEIDALFRDREAFDRLSVLRGEIEAAALEARTAELLWLEALPRQVDAELSARINRLSTEIERVFATHRPIFEGEPRSTNDLEEILSEETDSARLEAAWEALKEVGVEVAEPLLELVELRNRAARQVGYPDYHMLKLALYEQDPTDVEAFFERHAGMTDAPFAEAKKWMDARLAERLELDVAELRPWHYQNPFFQKAPDVYGAGLDAVYAEVDILAVARGFFARIGLPVDAILERSSVHEAPGKDPHAFAIDIDREGDVRILLNLRPNERWMGTALHELGHAVYNQGVDPGLPWMLRRAAHTVTTEAIAMLFGRLSKRATWMATVGLVDPAGAEAVREPGARELRANMLAFSRWAQVMTRFERALYEDPDRDLQRLWWELKAEYQGLEPPPRPEGAADWAAKIHVVVAPVYYHNYLLGECFASQIDARMREELGTDDPLAVADPRAGGWLVEQIFRPGARLHYAALARRATGGPVAPDAFAEQFLVPAGS
ncbi:MAG: M2 family metallopeptidase [Gemmatimonadetes bacterium]|nr:M2 family metallopeptidase [Gemmatimonadota bacterium]